MSVSKKCTVANIYCAIISAVTATSISFANAEEHTFADKVAKHYNNFSADYAITEPRFTGDPKFSSGHPITVPESADGPKFSSGHPITVPESADGPKFSSGHPITVPGLMGGPKISSGHPITAPTELQMAYPHTSSEISNSSSSVETSWSIFSSLDDIHPNTAGYYFKEPYFAEISGCSNSPSASDDFYTPDELGFTDRQVSYTYSKSDLNQLLADSHPKVLMHHGTLSNDDGLIGQTIFETVDFYNALSSNIRKIYVSNDGFLVYPNGDRAKLILPSLPSRIRAIEYALAKHEIKIDPGQIEALSLHYDCMGEMLNYDNSLVALGVRGTTLEEYDLQRIPLIDNGGRSGYHAIELKIISPLSIVTSPAYGAEGVKLYKRLSEVITLRVLEDINVKER